MALNRNSVLTTRLLIIRLFTILFFIRLMHHIVISGHKWLSNYKLFAFCLDLVVDLFLGADLVLAELVPHVRSLIRVAVERHWLITIRYAFVSTRAFFRFYSIVFIFR